jgi:predicted flavoprotein YhiN
VVLQLQQCVFFTHGTVFPALASATRLLKCWVLGLAQQVVNRSTGTMMWSWSFVALTL